MLQTTVVVEHFDVDNYLIVSGQRPKLKPQTNPAVGLVGFLVVEGYHGIGKSKKQGIGPALFRKAHFAEVVFVFEHLAQPRLYHVASAWLGAVYFVAKSHVVGRHGFGNSTRRAPRLKKLRGGVLSRADFGKRAINPRVEVDTQGFLFAAKLLIVLYCSVVGSHERLIRWYKRTYNFCASVLGCEGGG